MNNCTACGAPLNPDSKFCAGCGAQVEETSVPVAGDGADGSVEGSVAGLGLQWGARKIVGLIAAVVVGAAVPRIMPYVLVACYPVLSKVNWSKFGLTIERFNTAAVTALTLGSSFLIAFCAFRRKP